MSLLTLRNCDGYYRFDEDQCRSEGRRLAVIYQSAEPFPHVVLNDFLDADLLRAIAGAYPSLDGKEFFDRDQERLKFQFEPGEIECGLTLNILSELNGRAFLGFLQEMTGIGGLISDPYFLGGGLHLTRRGGHLGVHADFNIHEDLRLERRLNLLIYLNDNWLETYRGELELWDTAMTACQVKVAPVLGRAVIFNTSLDSYHGHPEPLQCPENRVRRSIATYYYTSPEQGLSQLPHRSTNFQTRPASQDKADWKIKCEHFISDWVPHKLQRYARKFMPFG